jgi:hypothetical protein
VNEAGAGVRAASRGERGFVAIEWVAAIALLLLPVVALVGTLPTWAERSHAAAVAGREAARTLEQQWPTGDPAAAALVAQYVAADHGIPAADVRVRILSAGAVPGDQIRVEVRVRMPAIAMPGLSGIASWSYTTVASLRVDDYRSR